MSDFVTILMQALVQLFRLGQQFFGIEERVTCSGVEGAIIVMMVTSFWWDDLVP